MHRRRRLRKALDSLQEYTLRKLIEKTNSNSIISKRQKNLKTLAMRSFDKFVAKAK